MIDHWNRGESIWFQFVWLGLLFEGGTSRLQIVHTNEDVSSLEKWERKAEKRPNSHFVIDPMCRFIRLQWTIKVHLSHIFRYFVNIHVQKSVELYQMTVVMLIPDRSNARNYIQNELLQQKPKQNSKKERRKHCLWTRCGGSIHADAVYSVIHIIDNNSLIFQNISGGEQNKKLYESPTTRIM